MAPRAGIGSEEAWLRTTGPYADERPSAGREGKDLGFAAPRGFNWERPGVVSQCSYS